jgi:hypothetical protein
MAEISDHWTRDPSLAPAVAGMHWLRGNFDTLPPTPILSIIEMTFKTEIDIQGVSQPAGKLWKATMEYLSTPSKLGALLWDPSVEKGDTFYLLLQWGISLAWQKFQKSFGIGLVGGLLAQPPCNRALKVQVDHQSVKALDAISLPLGHTISVEDKQNIEDRVSNSLNLASKTSNVGAWVQWLELDVPANPRPEIAPTKAAEQSQVLVILFSRRNIQDGNPGVDFQSPKSLAQAAMKATISLIEEKLEPASKVTFQPTTYQSTEALFKNLPRTEYCPDSEQFRQRDVIASGGQSKDPSPHACFRCHMRVIRQ